MPKSQVFTGVLWSSAQRFGGMLVTFIANLVLARLLSPADFGLVGMLMFFMAIAGVLVDSGFGSALIQRKNTTERDFSTVFILNMVLSVFLYVVLFFIAPFIAKFYSSPLLSSLLRIEGLALIINALAVVQTSILRKRMNFRRLAIANLTGNTLGTIVAIVAALLGCGVWSLVIRVVFVAVCTSSMLWCVSGWRPRREFDSGSAKSLFRFGGFILLSSLLNTISNNTQLLLIGKIFHQRELGLYSQATTLRNSAADGISSVIAQVLYPDYSRLNDDREIIEKLNRGFYIVSYLSTALLVFLFAVADPLIEWLYGSAWLPAAPYFQILCIGGIFYAIQDVNYFVVAAKGRSKLLFVCNSIKIPVYIVVLVIAGKLYGIYALIWVVAANSFVSYLIFSWMANHLLNYHIWYQLWSIIKSFLICILPALVLYFALYFLDSEPNIVKLVAGGGIFFFSLCGVSHIFGIMPYSYLTETLKIRKNG